MYLNKTALNLKSIIDSGDKEVKIAGYVGMATCLVNNYLTLDKKQIESLDNKRKIKSAVYAINDLCVTDRDMFEDIIKKILYLKVFFLVPEHERLDIEPYDQPTAEFKHPANISEFLTIRTYLDDEILEAVKKHIDIERKSYVAFRAFVTENLTNVDDNINSTNNTEQE